MTYKAKGRAIGREIRKATGLPLPDAMTFGKKIARNGMSVVTWGVPERLRKYVRTRQTCDCCGPIGYAIDGPKGTYEG